MTLGAAGGCAPGLLLAAFAFDVDGAATPAFVVLAVGVVSALCTGLGAIPFIFVGQASRAGNGYARAVAAGLMLGACTSLCFEGNALGPWGTLLGGVAGAALVAVLHWALDAGPGAVLGSGRLGRGDGARQAVLLVVVMTAHSFAEGAAIGVAFAGGEKLAVLIGVAICVHNIPEGVAISAVLRARGESIPRCAIASILTSAPQPLVAVPAYLAVESFRPLLPFGLGFAGGAMVLMVFLELLPEAYEEAGRVRTSFVVAAGIAAMLALDAAL